MSLYTILLFVHISAIALWVGGGVMFSLLGARASKAGPDPQGVLRMAEQSEWLGKSFFGPVSMIATAAGIWMVFEGSWGWGHFFIWYGIGMVVLSMVLGFAFYDKNSKQLVAIVRERGLDESAQAILKRIIMVSNIELLLLFMAIFAMTFKPFS